MSLNKKGALGPGMIKGAIVSLIFLTVFLSILPSLIHTSASAVVTLSQNFSENPDVYGTEAASLGGNIDDWTGYFWVLGPFVLIISIIIGIFMRRRR